MKNYTIEQLHLFAAALDAAAEGMIITETNGKIIYANSAFQKLTGYSEEELYCSTPSVLKSGLMDESVYKEMWSNALKGKPWRGIITNKNKNGSIYHADLVVSPIKDSAGKIIKLLGLQLDVSDKVKMETELKQYSEKLNDLVLERTAELELKNKELEQASKTKDNFISTISHELRTPLNGIIGMAELMMEEYYGKLNDKQTGFAQDILKSSKHLLDIINDMLDIAKIEAGKFDLNEELCTVKSELANIISIIKPAASKKEIEIDTNINFSDDYILNIDTKRFRQIILNLLSNAVKFTENKGRIKIDASMDGGRFYCSVSDTGIGISKEDICKLFQQFMQLNYILFKKTGRHRTRAGSYKKISQSHRRRNFS